MSDPDGLRDRERISILITRQLNPSQISLARRLGLEPTCINPLEFSYPEQWEATHSRLSRFKPDAMAFTSKHGVEGFRRYSSVYPVAFPVKRVYAVGSSTAEKLSGTGLNVRVPEEHNAVALANLIINEMEPGKVAWFCGSRRRTEFKEYLTNAGFNVLPLVVYHTLTHGMPVDLDEFQAISFYSPGAVEAFLGENEVPGLPVFAIGPTTASALKTAGFAEIIESPDTNTGALLNSIAGYFNIGEESTTENK